MSSPTCETITSPRSIRSTGTACAAAPSDRPVSVSTRRGKRHGSIDRLPPAACGGKERLERASVGRFERRLEHVELLAKTPRARQRRLPVVQQDPRPEPGRGGTDAGGIAQAGAREMPGGFREG